MKILIASDIHGSAYWAKQLVKMAEIQQPDKIILLGDLLYHGPRNDFPKDYAPKEVIPLLNDLAKSGNLIAVRGNCDAEVDQMVLDFPCMADYAQIVDEQGRTLFFTHGHIYGTYGTGLHGSSMNMPQLPEGSAFIYGHTHIKVNEAMGKSASTDGSDKDAVAKQISDDSKVWVFNPGSVSLPKDNSNSVGIYDSAKPINDAFSYLYLEDL